MLTRSGAHLAILTAFVLSLCSSSTAAVPTWARSCAALNARYPHGVGKVGARDKTFGELVTTFKRSNALYVIAKGRDRDKDGLACEKA